MTPEYVCGILWNRVMRINPLINRRLFIKVVGNIYWLFIKVVGNN